MRLSHLPTFGAVVTTIPILFCLVGAHLYYDEFSGKIIFISESGGRFPFNSVFGLSLTLGGVVIVLNCLLFVHIAYSRTPSLFPQFQLILSLIKFLSVVGGISLMLVGMVSVYDSFVIHTIAAQSFFLSTLLNVCLITFVSRKQVKALKHSNPACTSAVVFWNKFRLYCCALLPFFVLPYLFLPFFIQFQHVGSICAVLQYLSVFTLVLFFLSIRCEFRNITLTLSNLMEGIAETAEVIKSEVKRL
ncbi:hypothetical protein P9112_004594 [Eukaryota sp. TZLM1-RC]